LKERKRPITGGGLFRRNAEHMSRSHHGTLSRRRVDGQLTWLLIENIDLRISYLSSPSLKLLLLLSSSSSLLSLLWCSTLLSPLLYACVCVLCIRYILYLKIYYMVATTVATSTIIEAPNISKKASYLYTHHWSSSVPIWLHSKAFEGIGPGRFRVHYIWGYI